MQRLRLDPEGDNTDAYVEAARILRAGGLVAFPTETVYGLGALALDEGAVRKIFAAKGRPPDDPLIVHVRPQWDLTDLVADVPALARELIDAFWPGPLTIVINKGPAVPWAVTSGLPDVALRAPDHWLTASLLDVVAEPLAAPSANRFSYVSATTADHVEDDLGDSVDLILDGGPASAGIESTVVRVDGSDVIILRHGALTAERLRQGVPRIGRVSSAVRDDDASASPGRMLKHYSPATRTVAMQAGANPKGLDSGERPCLLTYSEHALEPLEGWTTVSLGVREDLDQVARDLYSKLRECDRRGHDLIVIELTGLPGLGAALDDRITRAASGRVLGR